MSNIYYPIIGQINKNHEFLLINVIDSIEGPNDKVISCMSSYGGSVNSASTIAGTIDDLPVKTIVLNKNIVYSSAAIVFLSFQDRYAFSDSKFLIHKCIPPKSSKRTKIFDDFDLKIFGFMAGKTKISLDEIIKLAEKNKKISAQEALEIGIAHKIIKGSFNDYRKIRIFKELLMTL